MTQVACLWCRVERQLRFDVAKMCFQQVARPGSVSLSNCRGNLAMLIVLAQDMARSRKQANDERTAHDQFVQEFRKDLVLTKPGQDDVKLA